jgi:hypothetical protein
MIVTNTDEGVHDVMQKVVAVVNVDDATTTTCTIISIIQDHAAVVIKFGTHGSQKMQKYPIFPYLQ